MIATTITITANFNLYFKLLSYILSVFKNISKIVAVKNLIYIISEKYF